MKLSCQKLRILIWILLLVFSTAAVTMRLLQLEAKEKACDIINHLFISYAFSSPS